LVRDKKEEAQYVILDAPDSIDTVPIAINDRGEISGWFVGGSQSGRTRGFLREPDSRIIVFDAPNSTYTSVIWMNGVSHIAGILAIQEVFCIADRKLVDARAGVDGRTHAYPGLGIARWERNLHG
jgi:hypothetical protein